MAGVVIAQGLGGAFDVAAYGWQHPVETALTTVTAHLGASYVNQDIVGQSLASPSNDHIGCYRLRMGNSRNQRDAEQNDGRGPGHKTGYYIDYCVIQNLSRRTVAVCEVLRLCILGSLSSGFPLID
jgi:hypothetical protein